MGRATVVGGKVGMKEPVGGLPSSYTELAWIQSSGTQYINTEFAPNQSTRVVMDMRFVEENTTRGFVFGARDGNKVKAFALSRIADSSTSWISEYGAEAPSVTQESTRRQIIDFDGSQLSIGGTEVTHTASTFQCSYPLCLFVLNTAGNFWNNATSLRLYSCQIYDNGTLVRDFIPCINPNGDIGLYDIVHGKFHENKGTDAFSYVTKGGIKASEISVGSTVYLNEDESPIEYLVVNHGIPSSSSLYDSSCDGVWLLRKNICGLSGWGNTNIGYQKSDLHTYLTDTFPSRFDGDVLSIISQVKIPYNTTPGSIQSGANGLSVKFFILGLKEAGWIPPNAGTTHVQDGAKLSYFKEGYGADTLRVATYRGTATQWWTRTALPIFDQRKAYFWAVNGAPSYLHDSNNYGIRPALILPFNALFDADTLVLKGVK